MYIITIKHYYCYSYYWTPLLVHTQFHSFIIMHVVRMKNNFMEMLRRCSTRTWENFTTHSCINAAFFFFLQLTNTQIPSSSVNETIKRDVCTAVKAAHCWKLKCKVENWRKFQLFKIENRIWVRGISKHKEREDKFVA